MKFGGSVTKKSEGFSAMTGLLRRYGNEPCVVVVSAFSSVTRDLQRAAMIAERGQETSAISQADEILSWHERFAESLLSDEHTKSALHLLFAESGKRLKELLRGVSITRECTPRTLDAILASGEYFAVHIAKHFLEEQGFNIVFADATGIIITDNQHLSAIPNREKTLARAQEKLQPLLAHRKMVITQGFVGGTENGEITTMGMESSNLTASLIGELLGADEVIIWTDVAGIRSADPHLARRTAPIPTLSYAQAYTAALSGVKLLHPKMIEPVRRAAIPLRIASAFEPDGDCTVVSQKFQALNSPIISVREGVCLLHIQFSTEKEYLHFETQRHLLFPNDDDVISLSVRNDSAFIVASILPSSVALGNFPVHTIFHDYSLISVFGASPKNVFSALAELKDMLEEHEYFLLEIGAQTDVARIAVPRSAAELLFVLVHEKLTTHS